MIADKTKSVDETTATEETMPVGVVKVIQKKQEPVADATTPENHKVQVTDPHQKGVLLNRRMKRVLLSKQRKRQKKLLPKGRLVLQYATFERKGKSTG